MIDSQIGQLMDSQTDRLMDNYPGRLGVGRSERYAGVLLDFLSTNSYLYRGNRFHPTLT